MYTQIYTQKCVFVKKFAISVGHKALFIVKLRDPIQNIARIIIKDLTGANECLWQIKLNHQFENKYLKPAKFEIFKNWNN